MTTSVPTVAPTVSPTVACRRVTPGACVPTVACRRVTPGGDRELDCVPTPPPAPVKNEPQ